MRSDPLPRQIAADWQRGFWNAARQVSLNRVVISFVASIINRRSCRSPPRVKITVASFWRGAGGLFSGRPLLRPALACLILGNGGA